MFTSTATVLITTLVIIRILTLRAQEYCRHKDNIIIQK